MVYHLKLRYVFLQLYFINLIISSNFLISSEFAEKILTLKMSKKILTPLYNTRMKQENHELISQSNLKSNKGI